MEIGKASGNDEDFDQARKAMNEIEEPLLRELLLQNIAEGLTEAKELDEARKMSSEIVRYKGLFSREPGLGYALLNLRARKRISNRLAS